MLTDTALGTGRTIISMPALMAATLVGVAVAVIAAFASVLIRFLRDLSDREGQ